MRARIGMPAHVRVCGHLPWSVAARLHAREVVGGDGGLHQKIVEDKCGGNTLAALRTKARSSCETARGNSTRREARPSAIAAPGDRGGSRAHSQTALARRR